MKHLLLSAAALFAVACTAPAEAPVEEAAGAPEKLHNNITEAEIIDGWALFAYHRPAFHSSTVVLGRSLEYC